MSKSAKTNRPATPRFEPRMQRHTQRAHTFTDRRKEAARKACRKGQW